MRSAMPDADVLKMVDELPRILTDDDDVGERILCTMRKLFVLCPTKVRVPSSTRALTLSLAHSLTPSLARSLTRSRRTCVPRTSAASSRRTRS